MILPMNQINIEIEHAAVEDAEEILALQKPAYLHLHNKLGCRIIKCEPESNTLKTVYVEKLNNSAV